MMLEEFRLQEKIQGAKLQNQWEQIAGKTIARYTRSIRVHQKKLYLEIDSAPLKNDLQYLKGRLMERINETIGPGFVEEVFIR